MSSNIKTLKDLYHHRTNHFGHQLVIGDLFRSNDELFKVTACEVPRTCSGCDHSPYNCTGIGCSREISFILKKVYPIVIIPGKSVEILGLKLLVEEGNSCKHCVLNNTVLCKQIDCNEHKCHIGYTLEHLAE